MISRHDGCFSARRFRWPVVNTGPLIALGRIDDAPRSLSPTGSRREGDFVPPTGGVGSKRLLRPVVFAANFRPVAAENEVVVDFAEAGWGLALGIAE